MNLENFIPMIFNQENLIIIKSMIKKYTNDIELGYEVRKLFRNDSFVLSLPNDGVLGFEIRKKFKNLIK